MQKQKITNLFILLILIIWYNPFFAQVSQKIINPSWIDSTASPKKDFYLYANGNWLKSEKIPNTKNRWGNLDQLHVKNHQKLIEILQNLEKKAQNKEQEQLRKFIIAYNDTIQRLKKKRAFLEEDIQLIQAIQTSSQLMEVLAKQHQEGISSMFNLVIKPDIRDKNKTHLFLEQKTTINQYENLQELYKSFEFSSDQTIVHCQNTIEIERRITQKRNQKSTQNSLNNEYNRLPINELTFRLNGLQMDRYFQCLDLPKIDFVILESPHYFYQLSELIQDVPLSTWKSYLLSNLMIHYEHLLNQKSMETNAKNTYSACLELIHVLPIREILEKKYIQECYNSEIHNKVVEMSRLLKLAFKDRLNENKWLENETKKIALQKLENMNIKIGTPEKWNNLEQIQLTEDNIIQNIKKCKIWEFKQKRNSLTYNEIIIPWENPVYSTDAFYNQFLNEVTIPAGIIQAPYFNVNNDDVTNFAALGALIGHEIIHGFDVWGAKFNAKKEYLNWWTKNDVINFEQVSEKIKKMYRGFCLDNNQCCQANNTIHEDLADLGGVIIAYYAYHKTSNYSNQKTTTKQYLNRIFFTNFAQMHACNYTDLELINRIQNDTHSLAQFRVNGVLMNLKEFHEAFNLQAEDTMKFKNSVEVW